MQGLDHELHQFRVSSAPFAASGQLDAFLDVWGRKILRMDIDPLDGHPLQIDAMLRSLPDFAMASGPRSPMWFRRPRELVDHDDLLLVVIAQGAGMLELSGRVTMVGEGEAVLAPCGRPADFAMPVPTRMISYRFSRDLLRPRVRHLDDLVAHPFARDNQVLRLLVGYSRVLNDQSALATAELRRAVSVHMHDLAALLLGATPEPSSSGGFQAARLKAVKDEILLRITQSDLSVDEIAGSQQISERYLRKLFASSGTTFTDFVREARLDRAHRVLTNPAQAQRPINAIAYESGFGDLSYFNRSFRQRYGMTPSDAREQARRENGARR